MGFGEFVFSVPWDDVDCVSHRSNVHTGMKFVTTSPGQ